MMKSLDRKLASILENPHGCREFILADAKDGDMAFGLGTPGLTPRGSTGRTSRFKSLDQYRQQARDIVRQGLVDIMLLSASSLEILAMDERLFEDSAVTPAARANDTTDIWAVRSGVYSQKPSIPFRSATIDHIKYGAMTNDHARSVRGADLGLYSITLVNDPEADHRTLTAYADFRIEAEYKRFRHFLEVFNPPADAGVPQTDVGDFLNDHIARTLAGVMSAGRPVFLKIPYNGPTALEELVAYDPRVIVGILGGAAGTTFDAFQLLHEARRHGARAALFGRKINSADDPLAFVRHLRLIADDQLDPVDAVKSYHGDLANAGITPSRTLQDDLACTSPVLNPG